MGKLGFLHRKLNACEAKRGYTVTIIRESSLQCISAPYTEPRDLDTDGTIDSSFKVQCDALTLVSSLALGFLNY